MKNLAGVKECDTTIKEELYLAGIEAIPAEAKGEVPYGIEGKIGNWRLCRAWTYWVASVEILTDGLPVDYAMELHNKVNPIDSDKILGASIRSGGDCTCPAPNGYVAQPEYNDDLDTQLLNLGYKKEYSKALEKEYIPINLGEIAELCNEGKLDVQRYVDNYHIDDQVGLNEFKKALKTYYSTEV